MVDQISKSRHSNIGLSDTVSIGDSTVITQSLEVKTPHTPNSPNTPQGVHQGGRSYGAKSPLINSNMFQRFDFESIDINDLITDYNLDDQQGTEIL